LRTDGVPRLGTLVSAGQEAFFLPSAAGQLFCLFRAGVAQSPRPGASGRPAVLVLPAFAEEMNKTRRMVSLFAQRAQVAGISTLIPDLYGTGDSEGDFGAATLETWAADLQHCLDWLVQRCPVPVSILAVRCGALLLELLPTDRPPGGRLVLWQPVSSGRTFVNQFLRLKLAGDLLSRGEGQADSVALRQELRQTGRIEVAGYDVQRELLAGIEAVELRNTSVTRYSRVTAFEVAAADSDEVSPALERVLSAWRTAGAIVASRAVQGDPFWATTEIATVPGLLDQTVADLSDPGDDQ
jgi:uncharacterized protein